ncbi:MAG: type II secretion system protein [Scytonema sp. PMC 1069.18]|nr:type II secretion system protein [Scytonema sp. PMC 1069.18]MEC4886998.1 type II secretion system protein [Scytonema sp. PMC 1070.18]
MASIYLIKQIQRIYRKKINVKHHLQQEQTFSNQAAAGFTLLELIAIVVMVGILGAIAAPGWLAFVNRQRVNKANDAVLGALQEAQRQAKKTKKSYSVSLAINNSTNKFPQIAIHPADATPDKLPAQYWKDLGRDLGIKPGEVILGTNITAQNTAGSSLSELTTSDKTKQIVTFDHMGMLPDFKESSTVLKIIVAVPQQGKSIQNLQTKRCVIVKTLLGAMQTGKDTECQ